MSPARIAITPVTAVTCDDAFRVIPDAAIHLEDGAITYVGPASDAPDFHAHETFGGPHLVAMPGLVNTHCHAAMTLLRGYADDMALEEWLQTKIWPFEGGLSAEDIHWGTQLAVAEMLQNGVTTFADMYFQHRRATEGLVASGIRALPSAAVIGVFPNVPGQVAEARDWAREMKGAGEGRVFPSIAPHSLYTCDREAWKGVLSAVEEVEVPIQTHASETRFEVEEVTRQWGATPIQALHEMGALEHHLIAAHCVHLDERDMEIMAQRRNGGSAVRVAHNPTSNCKLASGVAPVPELRRRGVDVGLATDGVASNNRLDVWGEMRLTALIHKAVSLDPTEADADAVLRMATLGGAEVLGLGDQVGSLEVGKRGDVVLVDFDKPHLHPLHNVVSHLVYAADARDVATVLVDGRPLFHQDEFRSVDVEKAKAEVQGRARALARKAEESAG